jgi:tetrahydromethanopterin S-methyltransferase subunit D
MHRNDASQPHRHDTSQPQRRLLPLAIAYLPVATVGAALSLAYGVGAHPGGDPAQDLLLRGTALAPPLFLPAALVGAAGLARQEGWPAAAGTGVVGLVGLAFMAGSTLNLPNDLDAARAAGSPVGVTIGMAVVHWLVGLGLAGAGMLAIRSRPEGLSQSADAGRSL